MEPNLAGFREAQERLIRQMDESIVLLTPVEGTWPADTRLDTETGLPLDPWVRATGSGFASASVDASVAFRPITTNKAGVQASNAENALGIKGTLSAAAIMVEEDYRAANGGDATEAIYGNRRYRIEDRVFDPMPQHRILYLEPM